MSVHREGCAGVGQGRGRVLIPAPCSACARVPMGTQGGCGGTLSVEAWQLMATAFTKYRLHQSSSFPAVNYYLSSNFRACLSSSQSRAAKKSFHEEKLISLFWIL